MEPLVDEYCSHEMGDAETLLIACRNGQQSIVEWLTRERDFDLSNGKAINAAVASGNEKILTRLLDLRDNSDPISPYSTFSVRHYGHIPLSLASANGHEAIVEILCQRGAPINKKIDDSGKTALSAAASNGHDHVVRNLIAKRARLLQTGTTPLHCAAENGHDVVVRTILQTNAYYDHKDDPPNVLFIPHLAGALDREEETPLHKAARNGHRAVVEELLELSPVIQKWISAGTKPLPYWGGLEKQMAIHLAASNGHVGVLELLSSRVSIDSRTSRGRTPLLVAAAEGHVPAIQWLYRNGANANMVDENGHNAIATAVIRGHEEAVQALVELQQPITPGLLVLAAGKRQEAVLPTLIERVPKDLLKEAWMIALAEKQVEAAQLLSTFFDHTVSEADSE